ncbi:MAG TPA: hypothetical protein VK035_00245, partial [Kiloniellales bacterium]|nr:hypothetical protein [Kiloniellales bacterium]
MGEDRPDPCNISRLQGPQDRITQQGSAQAPALEVPASWVASIFLLYYAASPCGEGAASGKAEPRASTNKEL